MTLGVSHGGYLVASLAALLVLGALVSERRRRRTLARIGPDTRVAQLARAYSGWRRLLGQAMLVLGICLCALAAMRPQVRAPGSWEQHGIDLVLALDYSQSMLTRDVRPDRLQRMTRAVERVLDGSVDHRVGIVVFAGAAAHFPLTHDREAARSMFHGLDVQILAPGSNLEEAVLVGRCLVRAGLEDDPDCRGVGGRGRGGDPIPGMDDPGSDANPLVVEAPDARMPLARERWEQERARALVLFTDGEETRGDARAELARAAALGVEVFIVGVGTVGGGPVPELDPAGYQIDWKRDKDGTPVRSRLDLQKLAGLAEIAGGSERLFSIGSGERSVDQLRGELDQLQRGSLGGKDVTRYRDVYERFLLPGFLLLLLEGVVSARRRRSRGRRAIMG